MSRRAATPTTSQIGATGQGATGGVSESSYLARIAEPVQRDEQVLAPRPGLRAWHSEVLPQREEITVNRSSPIPPWQELIEPHESGARADVNHGSVAEAEDEQPRNAQSASRFVKRNKDYPNGTFIASVFGEVSPTQARLPNASNLEAVTRSDLLKKSPAATEMQLEQASLNAGQDGTPATNKIARPLPATRQAQIVVPESMETRLTEKPRRERKPGTSAHRWSEGEVEKTAFSHQSASSDTVLNSRVISQLIDTKAAGSAQQSVAKHYSRDERERRESQPSAGTRITIGAIEVRTVVRQAAPKPANTQSQLPAQSTGRNPGSSSGSLARGLGWRFGLVQG